MKKDRFYLNDNGVHVPSGTTVLPRPYLAKWAANCAVDYAEANFEVGKWTEIESKQARTAFERESMQAADYGTYIHSVCQYSLENDIELESPHDLTDKFMKGLWKWKTKHKVKVIAMEHEVACDTYGGRLDMVCELDGVVTLIDFKTGKASYYDTWKWQLAGYRQAWNSAYGTSRSYSPYLIARHGILKFNKTTGKVNYKDFTEYQATRTNPKTLEKEKYTRTYEDDRNTFNSFVKSWWLINRGMEV